MPSYLPLDPRLSALVLKLAWWPDVLLRLVFACPLVSLSLPPPGARLSGAQRVLPGGWHSVGWIVAGVAFGFSSPVLPFPAPVGPAWQRRLGSTPCIAGGYEVHVREVGWPGRSGRGRVVRCVRLARKKKEGLCLVVAVWSFVRMAFGWPGGLGNATNCGPVGRPFGVGGCVSGWACLVHRCVWLLSPSPWWWGCREDPLPCPG
jgi:hypothetical protein